MSQKRIFVTGAAGFIGFSFAMHCASMDHYVVGIDNFNEYYSVQLKKDRAAVLKKAGVSVLEHDVCEREVFKKLIEKEKITHVVHLAAQAGVRFSLTNPDTYVRANIDGFLSVLEVLRSFPGIPLIYASSSSVYGKNPKIPFSIYDATDLPANFYGVTKRSNELMASCYHSLYHIPVTGLRFFTVYGPWGRPDMAYFSFTKSIFEERPIDVYNYGNMARDFTYIDDIVAGIVQALEKKEGCSLYNLGNSTPEPLKKLIQLIEQEIGKKAHVRLLPLQEGEITQTYADIEASKKELFFSPKVLLEEGIHKFVSWYRSYYN